MKETEMKTMTVITYVAGVLSLLMLLAALFGSNGAPQEAAGAAIALAIIAIPYCITATMQRAKLLASKSHD